jgi:serine/threonine-protein kinase
MLAPLARTDKLSAVRGKRVSASYMADPRGAARLVAVVAEAVHHAHQRGSLHRDLKPANILLDERGEPHVTDFGLAKRITTDSDLTQSGAIMGTPLYMSPEQASGVKGSNTTATDVYGLGSILYALLAGRAPFSTGSAAEALELVRHRPPEPPSRRNRQVPRDLVVICLKCLEKEPARRYPSAMALAEDLSRWLEGKPVAARPVGRLRRAGMTRPRSTAAPRSGWRPRPMGRRTRLSCARSITWRPCWPRRAAVPRPSR